MKAGLLPIYWISKKLLIVSYVVSVILMHRTACMGRGCVQIIGTKWATASSVSKVELVTGVKCN